MALMIGGCHETWRCEKMVLVGQLIGFKAWIPVKGKDKAYCVGVNGCELVILHGWALEKALDVVNGAWIPFLFIVSFSFIFGAQSPRKGLDGDVFSHSQSQETL